MRNIIAKVLALASKPQEQEHTEQAQQTPPPPPPPKRRRFYRGVMENGKLTLEEYEPAYDFKDIPKWLVEGSFFRSVDRKHDNKALLLEVARVAYLRATLGAKEAKALCFPDGTDKKEATV